MPLRDLAVDEEILPLEQPQPRARGRVRALSATDQVIPLPPPPAPYEPTLGDQLFGRDDTDGGNVVGILPSIAESLGDTVLGSAPLKTVAGRVGGDVRTALGAGVTRGVEGVRALMAESEAALLERDLPPGQDPYHFLSPEEQAARAAQRRASAAQRLAVASEAGADLKGIQHEDAGILERGVVEGVALLGQLAPGALVAGPVGGAAALGGIVAGQKYADRREEGIEPEAAQRSAVLLSLLETVGEIGPTKVLMKNAPGYEAFKRKLAEFFARELPTEYASAAGDIADEYALQLREDVTGQDLLDAFSETTLMTLAQGGAQVGTAQAVQSGIEAANQAAARRAADATNVTEDQILGALEGKGPPGTALPAPPIVVDSAGQAGTPAQHEAADAQAQDLATQFGLSPDIVSNLARLEERKQQALADAPPALALPAPDQTLYVDTAGRAGSAGQVADALRAVEALAQQRVQEKADLGLTPDIEANLERLEASKPPPATLAALPPPDPAVYVDPAGQAGTLTEIDARRRQGNEEAAAATEFAAQMGFTPDVAYAAQSHPAAERPPSARPGAAPRARPLDPAEAVIPLQPQLGDTIAGPSPGPAGRRGGPQIPLRSRGPDAPADPIEDLDAPYVPSRPDPAVQAAQLEATGRELDEFMGTPPAEAKPGKSVLQFLAGKGGLSIAALEAEGIDRADMRGVRGFKRPFTKKGMTLDAAAELLAEAGYDVGDGRGGYSANRVLDLVSDEIRGKASFPLGAQQSSQAPTERRAGESRAGADRRGPPPRDGQDRRVGDRRVRVGEMSRDELVKALTTSRLTGLPNRVAYDEAQRLPVQASLDVDSLKWVNDTMGHESGDRLLQLVGEAIAGETDKGYHFSGDEFVIEGASDQEIREIMESVGERLAKAQLEITKSDGTVVTLDGIGVSYGTGANLAEADEHLGREKAAREASGARAGRGEQPAGATVGRRGQEGRSADQGNAAAEDVELSEEPDVERPAGADEAARRHGFDPAEIGWTQGRGPLGRGKFMASTQGSSSNLHATAADALKELAEFVEISKQGAAERRAVEEAQAAVATKLRAGEQPSFAEWRKAFPQLREGHTYLRQPDIAPFLVRHFGFSKAKIREPLGRAAGKLRSDSGATYPIVYFNRLADVLKGVGTDVLLAEEQGDLFGKNETAQSLADRERAKDSKRSPNRDVSADLGIPGDLFSTKRQLDIDDAGAAPKREPTTARGKFLAYAQETGGLTREQAETAYERMKKDRAIKIDPSSSSFTFTHGAFGDRAPIRRAAGLEDADDTHLTTVRTRDLEGSIEKLQARIKRLPPGDETREGLEETLKPLLAEMARRQGEKTVEQQEERRATPRGWEGVERVDSASVTDMKAAVRELFAGAKNMPPVDFVAGTARIPKAIRDRMRQSPGQTWAGLYDPTTNRVIINTEVVQSPAQAQWVAAHEISGHYGLRGFVGKMAPDARARLDKMLEIAQQNPTVAKLAKEIKRQRTKLRNMQPVEEALAELQGARATGNWGRIKARYGVDVPKSARGRVTKALDRFIERLKALLQRVMGVKFTDSQVADLLEGADRYVRESDGTPRLVRPEVDKTFDPRPKTGAYQPRDRAQSLEERQPDLERDGPNEQVWAIEYDALRTKGGVKKVAKLNLEGPWDSKQEAEEYLRAEVGAKSARVVSMRKSEFDRRSKAREGALEKGDEDTDIMLAEDVDTDTAAFKRWFGDSKVVDESGAPQKVYHSTSAPDFKAFRRKPKGDIGMHFGTRQQALDRFTYRREIGVTAPPSGAPRTIPAYLSITNPLRLNDIGSWSLDNLDTALDRKLDWWQRNTHASEAAIRKTLQAHGYDGIVYKNTGESDDAGRSAELRAAHKAAYKAWDDAQKKGVDGEDLARLRRELEEASVGESNFRENVASRDSWIAFEPTQIKSAVGNRGTFDPADSDILMSEEAADVENVVLTNEGHVSSRSRSGKHVEAGAPAELRDAFEKFNAGGKVTELDLLDITEGLIADDQIQDPALEAAATRYREAARDEYTEHGGRGESGVEADAFTEALTAYLGEDVALAEEPGKKVWGIEVRGRQTVDGVTRVQWNVLPEGPFESEQEAQRFADNEVGDDLRPRVRSMTEKEWDDGTDAFWDRDPPGPGDDVELAEEAADRRRGQRRDTSRTGGRRKSDGPSAKGDRGYRAVAQRAINTWNQKAGWRYGPLGKLPATRAYLKERYEALGRIGRSQAIARDVFEAFRKATPAQAQAIYQYLITKDGDSSTIDDRGLRDVAQKTKRTIDAVGKRLVEEGLLSQEAYEAHAGEYLPRVYLKHMLGERAVRAIGAGKSTSDMGYLKKRMSEEALPKEVRDVILGQITDPAFLASFSLGRTLRDLALIDFFKTIAGNKRWVPEGATVEWNGRNVSPFWMNAEAQQLRRRARLYAPDAKAKALAIAEKMETEAQKAIEALGEKDLSAYQQMPDSARYGVLRGLWLRKEIFNDLVGQRAVGAGDSMAERILGDGGLLSGLTRAFKISKVVLNPPAQVRNFMSNLALLQLSGVPARLIPKRIGQSIRSLAKKDKYYQIYEKFGGTAATWQANEVREITQEWLRIKELDPNPLQRMLGLAAALVNKASNTYGTMEGVGKIAKLIDAMEREGKSPADAMLDAHEALFDYSLVHPNVRYLRNNPLGAPFLTFQYKVLPQLAKTLAKHPERFAPYAAIPMLLASMLLSDYDVDDEDVEKLKRAFPAWMRERGQMLLLPWKDKLGRWQVADMGYIVPWGLGADLYATARENPGKAAKNLLQQVALGGPLTDVAAALETNIDPFTGREIVNPADPPADKLKAMMLYAWNLAMPGFITERGAIPQTARAVTGKNVNVRGELGQTSGQAMLRMFGINVYPVDPEKTRAANLRSMEYAIQEREARLAELLRDRALSSTQREEIRSTWRKILAADAKAIEAYSKDSEIHPNLKAKGPADAATD